MTKRIMECRRCGGQNVRRDAWAEWDMDTQEWVLSNVFDEAACDDCEQSTTIREVRVDEET